MLVVTVYSCSLSGKLQKLMNTKIEATVAAAKDALKPRRLVSLGQDIWTNKGLSASFLGISCGFSIHQLVNHAMLF